MKKKYWDASHNCSAFTIGRNHELTRCSDDGEPAQTAGRPMLDVLLGEDVHDLCVVVTRYFGGTLLGTGGLVRAYTDQVEFKLLVPVERYEDLEKQLIEGTNGGARLEKGDEIWYGILNKEVILFEE